MLRKILVQICSTSRPLDPAMMSSFNFKQFCDFSLQLFVSVRTIVYFTVCMKLCKKGIDQQHKLVLSSGFFFVKHLCVHSLMNMMMMMMVVFKQSDEHGDSDGYGCVFITVSPSA